MPKLLSYDAIFAALTVVAVGTGCARKDEAPKATAEAVPAAAQPPGLAAAPPKATLPTEAPVVAAPAAVDAGVEARKAAPHAPSPKKGLDKGSAACGAGTCSADMKK